MATKLIALLRNIWNKLFGKKRKVVWKPDFENAINEAESRDRFVVQMPLIEPIQEEKKQATEDIARQLLEALKPKPDFPPGEEIIIRPGKSAGEETIKAPIVPIDKFKNAALAIESPRPDNFIPENPFNITGNKVTDWSFKTIWNEASTRPEREIKQRYYCYASELGKPLIDRYLSMRGTAYSNPPNKRSQRKFLFGDIVEEFANIIISLLGVRVDRQQKVVIESTLNIHGKIDFLVQGLPDYDRARHDLKKLYFSEGITYYLGSVIDKFEEKIGQRELAPIIRECKSVSDYAIEHVKASGGMMNHKLQVYPYLKGTDIRLAYVDYISKADSLMEECRVEYPDKDLDTRIEKDLSTLKGFLEANQRPPAAPLITFENKFSKNFGVEYSSYLTLVYGFQTPEDYRNSVQNKIASWNRVLKRLQYISEGKTTPTGKPITLTSKNQIAIDEIAREGFGDAHALAKQAKIVEDEEEETI